MTTDQERAARALQAGQRRRARYILRLVAAAYGLTVATLRAPGRTPEVAEARHVAAYLMRTECRWPLPDSDHPFPYELIGQLLGRDHSTVINSVRRVEQTRDHPCVAAMLRDVRRALAQWDAAEDAQPAPSRRLGYGPYAAHRGS